MDFVARLKKNSACPIAVEWASQFASIQAAWDACERGDWMLWLCQKFPRQGNNKRAYVQVALAVAESVKDYAASIPEAKAARDAARAWLDKPSAKTMAAAMVAARNALSAAATTWNASNVASNVAASAAGSAVWSALSAAMNARSAAENAASAAGSALSAAMNARSAAENAASAAGDTTGSMAERAQLKRTADICRQYLYCPEL